MNFKEKIDKYIEDHANDMLEDIMELIRIDSVKSESVPGKPFGEKTALALNVAYGILNKYGFACKNYDNYVVTGDINKMETNLDILAHLDVVPAHTKWSITEPFSPVVQGNRLYGRGSSDDKGPAVAAIYAMRAIKELKIPLSKNVRIILGSDEESGSNDIAYYYKQERPAPMTVSPDAEFPLVNIEKAILHGEFRGNYTEEKLPACINKVHAGDSINVIPEIATAELFGAKLVEVQQLCFKEMKNTGIEFDLLKMGEMIQVTSRGKSCHAASPELGNNALTGLLDLLANDYFTAFQGYHIISVLNNLFPHGIWNGEPLGINMRDEVSGELEISLTKMQYHEQTLYAGFDCRAPLCATNENLRDVIKYRLKEHEMFLGNNEIYAAHYVPEDSEFVQKLLLCYEMYSQKKEKPIAIGGGSYVHAIENGVAFGCADKSVDNHMHGADEFVQIEQLLMSSKIYAQTIIQLCS